MAYENGNAVLLQGIPVSETPPTNGQVPTYNSSTGEYEPSSGGGSGTVTTVSVTTANGVSGSVANPTTTPAITLTLGAITPSTVNGLTLASQTTGFTIAGGTTSKTLTVPADASVSGTNTGDQDLSGYALLAGADFTGASSIANNFTIKGNYYIDWRDNTGVTTYAYLQANNTNFIVSAVNVPLSIQYGALGSLIGASLDTAGNWIFNYSAQDADFSIMKNTAGTAYTYDAGTDTHTFGSTVALGSNNLTMTGSLGATGAGKLTKIWSVDAEFTNLPTINGGTLATALSLSSYAPLAGATFTGAVAVQHASGLTLGKDDATNTAGVLKMFSAGANDYYNTFTAGTNTANATYTLPVAMPAVTGYVLTCTDAGVMSWAAGGGSFTWGATASGTSGTGVALTISDSADATAVGQSITFGNTQSNASEGLKILTGTSAQGHHAIDITMQNDSSSAYAMYAPSLYGNGIYLGNSSSSSVTSAKLLNISISNPTSSTVYPTGISILNSNDNTYAGLWQTNPGVGVWIGQNSGALPGLVCEVIQNTTYPLAVFTSDTTRSCPALVDIIVGQNSRTSTGEAYAASTRGLRVSSNSTSAGYPAASIITGSSFASTPLQFTQNAVTSTNFRKIIDESNTGITIWISDGTTANGALSGTAGDICLNAGSNKPEYCTGTTNWTALV